MTENQNICPEYQLLAVSISRLIELKNVKIFLPDAAGLKSCGGLQVLWAAAACCGTSAGIPKSWRVEIPRHALHIFDNMARVTNDSDARQHEISRE